MDLNIKVKIDTSEFDQAIERMKKDLEAIDRKSIDLTVGALGASVVMAAPRVISRRSLLGLGWRKR
jgi:hypothetical protein